MGVEGGRELWDENLGLNFLIHLGRRTSLG